MVRGHIVLIIGQLTAMTLMLAIVTNTMTTELKRVNQNVIQRSPSHIFVKTSSIIKQSMCVITTSNLKAM